VKKYKGCQIIFINDLAIFVICLSIYAISGGIGLIMCNITKVLKLSTTFTDYLDLTFVTEYDIDIVLLTTYNWNFYFKVIGR